jgi:phosphoheptose isomerase
MSGLVEVLTAQEERLASFTEDLARSIAGSQRVLTAGNGGSSAIASHMVADVMKTVGRFDLPSAICLTDNVPLLTAMSNDISYVDALANIAALHHVCEDDCVVIISSSGNSDNVVNLARMSLSRGATVYAMVGFQGGRLASMLEDRYVLHVKSNDYGVVEDVHHHVVHRLVRALK